MSDSEAPQGSSGGTTGRVLAGLVGAAVVGLLFGFLALPRLISGADSGTRLASPTVVAQQPVATPMATAIPPTATALPLTATPPPPTPTATPVPPTATPRPPTATPTQVPTPTPTRPPSSVFAPEPTEAPPPQAPGAAAPPATGGTPTPTPARGPFVATHVVAANLPVNFRAGPGTTYPSQGALAPGTRLAATGNAQTTDGALWIEFRLADGAMGWILAPYVAPV